MLNLFYAEPDEDRWLPLDRFPRRAVRRLVRGPKRPGGHMRVFLNLRAGLDRIGVPYRCNDFGYARRNPAALACILGKAVLLDARPWRNPILFGPSGYAHPIDDPDLLSRLPVRKVLVPGPWMLEMCRPYWGDAVAAWPVGIDTALWAPTGGPKTLDVLLYDKVMWDRPERERSLLEPIRAFLRGRGLSVREIRYGAYQESHFQQGLAEARTMIFLCEHETQGIAYQQALASGVPIFAWDRHGPWLDPSYYPERVQFGPASSVPYWDERCGRKFADRSEFEVGWDAFWDMARRSGFSPRDYILENLTLEACATRYVALAQEAQEGAG